MSARPPSPGRGRLAPPSRGQERRGGPPLPGTLGAWLYEAVERLSKEGVPSPRSDAQRLAAAGLDTSWGELWRRLRDPLTPAENERLSELLERRCRREPLAYILGSVEFFGLTLEVGPEVLVPRPETEVLVEVALNLVADDSEGVVVDAGTGSGAIALAVAVQRPRARVYATDTSAEALAYARRNAEAAGGCVTLLQGDLLGPLPPDLGGRIDLIVSNPPYVPEGRADLVDPDVLAEPHAAVFAGPRGDEVLRRLVDESPPWLAPSGALAMEVGTPEQAVSVLDLVEGWAERGLENDAQGRPRVVWARGPV